MLPKAATRKVRDLNPSVDNKMEALEKFYIFNQFSLEKEQIQQLRGGLSNSTEFVSTQQPNCTDTRAIEYDDNCEVLQTCERKDCQTPPKA